MGPVVSEREVWDDNWGEMRKSESVSELLEGLLSSEAFRKVGGWMYDFKQDIYIEPVLKRLKKSRNKLRKYFQYFTTQSNVRGQITLREVKMLHEECKLEQNYGIEMAAVTPLTTL